MSQALAGIVAEIRERESQIAAERKKLEGLSDREEAGVIRCRIRAGESYIANLKSMSGEIAAAQHDALKTEENFVAWRSIVAEIRSAEDQRDKLTRDLASTDEEVSKLQGTVKSAVAAFQRHADAAPRDDDFALASEIESHSEKAKELEKAQNHATQKLRDASFRQSRLQMDVLGAKKKIGELAWREAQLRSRTPEHESDSMGIMQSVR